MTPPTSVQTVTADRWYLAAQNDGLFIINAPPRPSNDEVWHDRPDGPSVVLNVTELPEIKAIKIVGAMNALTSSLTAAEARGKRLEDALSAAKGYLLNARIDLSTGCTKATAIATINGGLKMIDAALSQTEEGPR